MTPLSYAPISSVPCGHCGAPSVRMTSWPDGQYHAACAEHLDAPQQVSLFVEVVS